MGDDEVHVLLDELQAVLDDGERVVAHVGHAAGGLGQGVAADLQARPHGEGDDARAVGQKTVVVVAEVVLHARIEHDEAEGPGVVPAQDEGQPGAVALLVGHAVV